MNGLRIICGAALLPWAALHAVTKADLAQLAPPKAPIAAPAAPSPSAPNQTEPAAIQDDIRDIRGPISIPYSWIWVAYVAGALVVAAALALLWRRLRRPRPVKPVPAHEIALARLEKARPLMVPERAREYSFAVSEIVREYIESRFGEKAARRTTEEFLRDLVELANTPLGSHRVMLEDVLKYCDLAKFARWQLSDTDMSAMYDSARAFILATRPRVEALEAKGTPGSAPVSTLVSTK